jgi:hypothetical protein
MEKYGVDFKDLPPTDEQIRQIVAFSKKAGEPYIKPANREDADRVLEKLSNTLYARGLMEKKGGGEGAE